MLGQQGWRILSSPESLCARDLKGRYFPQGVFWHAEAPRSTSYTWRNILFGRELLKHGVQWALAMVRRFESSVTTVFPPRRHTCSNRSSRSRQMLLFGASWMMILAPGTRRQFTLSSMQILLVRLCSFLLADMVVMITLDGLTTSLVSTQFDRPTICGSIRPVPASSERQRSRHDVSLCCYKKELQGHLVNQGTEQDESGVVKDGT